MRTDTLKETGAKAPLRRNEKPGTSLWFVFHKTKMFKFQQTILVEGNSSPFLTPDLLQKVAPKYLECPDFTRVVIQDIQIIRVCNDRSGVYSVVLSDKELMEHVSTLRDPKGDTCLVVLDPLGGYELKHPEKTPRDVTVEEVVDDPMIESEFHNSTLDVTSVLFAWSGASDKKHPKVVSSEEEANIILKHRRFGHVFDATTKELQIQLINHIKENSTGPILLTFEVTLGIVESLAINDKARRSPSI
jgi:hypothetical protein